MISMYLFEQIRSLVEAGASNSEIARRLGIHRSTVRKYKSANTRPKYKARDAPTRANPLATYEPLITEWLANRPGVSATSVFQVLWSKGYRGSLRTVERRLGAFKSQLPKERFYEQHYEPGEQAQFDFKESIELPFTAGPRTCHLLIGTLPYSDFFFAKAFPNKTFEAFADGMHSFFAAIGGLTRNIRFDNLSPVVKKVLKGSDRIYTTAFERLRSYYGFTPLPCAPAKGNEKGDCERDIRTFSRRISEQLYLTGKAFKSFDEINEWLREFAFAQLSDKSRAGLQEESTRLSNLPPHDEDILCQVQLVTATKHGTVRLSKCSYSVPDTMILRQTKVVVSAYDVRIYQISPCKKLVACHPRISENTSSIQLEHVISSLVRKPQAMVRWAHRSVLFPVPILEKYYQYLQKVLPHGAESEYLKSLNLIHHTSLAELSIGIELVIENKSRSPFFDLKTLVTSSKQPPNETGDLVQDQTPIEITLSTYDSLIPA